jgi:hypothetical protein
VHVSSGSGSLRRNSLTRLCLETAAWFLSLGDSVAKASAVKVAGFGVSVCKRSACERDEFDLGGWMGLVWLAFGSLMKLSCSDYVLDALSWLVIVMVLS